MKLSFWLLIPVFMTLFLPCHGQLEKGKASYYSDSWKGRRTASGEKYQPDSLTCAHKTLPFGTKILVTWPAKGTSVVVKVNDRGPFGKGRIVDLSSSAARKLDMIRAGIAEVEIQPILEELPVPLFPSPSIPELLNRRTVVAITDLNPSAQWASPVLSAPSANSRHADASGRPRAKNIKRSSMTNRR